MRRENAAAAGEAARRSALRIDCDAVLFDMDGTLVDSTAVVERHWRRWAAEHGVDLAEILRVSHGRPTLETLRIVAPHLATIAPARRQGDGPPPRSRADSASRTARHPR